MDYLFDNVYDDSFDLGMKSYIDDDYALEMTDEQLRRKADLQAKLIKKHPELDPQNRKLSPGEAYGLSKSRRNDVNRAVANDKNRPAIGNKNGNKYTMRAIYRNTTHADRVQAFHDLSKGRSAGGGFVKPSKSFLGAVASESFNEGYLQALEDYGYFE